MLFRAPLLLLLLLSACASDLPATPAPSGITANSYMGNATGGGSDPGYSARGSRLTIGRGAR